MAAPESSKQSNREDLRLVARAREGDPEAFSRLVSQHYERIFGTVYSLIGNRDDADDLTQEVFLKAYRSLGRFRGKSQFYTWLYRIGVNACLDWLKSRKRRSGDLSVEREQWEGREDRGLTGQVATDAGVERQELQAILEQALDTLPDEYRMTVVLREIDGLAYEEIADLLRCNVGTVKSRLFRARMRLRTVLERDYRIWFEA